MYLSTIIKCAIDGEVTNYSATSNSQVSTSHYYILFKWISCLRVFTLGPPCRPSAPMSIQRLCSPYQRSSWRGDRHKVRRVRGSHPFGDSPCNEHAKGKVSSTMFVLWREVILPFTSFFCSNFIHQTDASSPRTSIALQTIYASDDRETRI